MMIPFGPWTPDQPTFGREGTGHVFNMLPSAMGFVPFGSLESVSRNPIQTPLAYIEPNPFSFRQIAFERSRVLIAARPVGRTTNRFYDAISGQDISNPLHANIRQGQFARYGDLILAADIGMPVQQLTLGGAQLENVANSPRARNICVINRFAVVGHTFDPASQLHSYRRVAWSGLGDITQWTPTENQSGFQQVSSPVQALVGGQNDGLIFCSDSIIRMDFQGIDDLVFSFTRLFGIGADAASSIVEFDDRIFFVADGNFYQIYARSSLTNISDEQVARFYKRTSNADDRANISGAIDYKNRCICWIYGGSRTALNNMLIYDLKTEQWSFAQVPSAYRLTFHIRSGSGFEDLGASEVVTQQGKQVSNSDVRSLAAIDPNGRVHTFSGPPLTGQIESTEMGGPDRTHIISVRAYITGGSNTRITARLGLRNSLIDTIEYTEPVPVDTETGKAYFDLDARYYRVAFDIFGNYEHVIGYEFETAESGDR